MLELITQKKAQSILSSVAAPAKISAVRVNKKVSSMEFDQVSGLSNCESTENLEQLSLFGKTSWELLGTDLQKFSGAFPKAGTMRSGKLSAQVAWVRHTREIESFSLPTPQAYSFRESHRPGLTPLDHKLRRLLPTPTAQMAKHGHPTDWEIQHRGNDLHVRLILAAGQVLNPQFVEWLMGFPIDWTDLAD